MSGNIDYFEQLIQKNFIFPPDLCTCGNKKFQINKYSRNKKTKFCFLITKNNCRKIFSLRNNSFYESFKFLSFYECEQLLQCFILSHFSANKAKEYLYQTKKLLFI